MTSLVKHNLSRTINWVGANNKGSFEKLQNVLGLTRGKIFENIIEISNKMHL